MKRFFIDALEMDGTDNSSEEDDDDNDKPFCNLEGKKY